MGYYTIVAIAVVALDQFTKYLVMENLGLYEARVIVPGFFNLVHVTNTGAAFSFLADVDSPWRHYFFLTVSGVAIIGLTVGQLFYGRQSRWYVLSFALIAGGAAGNLIDRVLHGAVIDFLDVYVGSYHWPAFNVADSAICVGAGLFILLTLREKGDSPKK